MMALVETIVCKDCGALFPFTDGERQFFSSQGWKKPVRCKACRTLKKKRREAESKYYGLYEAMRNSSCMKRDTKGTIVNRSGSEWNHIDAVYLAPDDLFNYTEEEEIDEEYFEFACI